MSDAHLKGTGVTTMDIAKGLLEKGHHPPTVYFPLVVSGAMLIEPTESESIDSLNHFANSMIELADQAHGSDEEKAEMHAFPVRTPVRRCDEVGAARKPILRWTPPTIV